MAKIDQSFQHDMFKFIHKPIRDADIKEGRNFVERFLIGSQTIFEDTQAKIQTLGTLLDPETTPQPRLLKDHVGFTRELNNITNDISDNDLRKLISLAVALWKQKGTEPGYANIVRLFIGKTARIFNWFDFRMIVGEKAFGEEQLGEDAWLISVPGVELSQPINNVVSLITYEGNALDRSLSRNHGSEHGLGVDLFYFNTPNSGFPQGSTKFAKFLGGQITIPNSVVYDLSGDWTAEVFIRPTGPAGVQTLINKRDASGKGFQVFIDTVSNELLYVVSDGINTVAKTLSAVANLDDGVLRHLALVANRTNNQIRMYLNGTEATGIEPFGLVGDITNNAPIVLGGSAVGVGAYLGDMDNFRLALNAVYDTSLAVLLPPLTGFIEFQEELLDEFQTDIRIVDDGSGLNKTLILRIINLMRPISERVNVVFIKFFDDFIDGIGQFETLAGSAGVNIDQQMEIQPSSLIRTDVLDDAEFQDIVLQTKANDTDDLGGEFSILFFMQDATNYYEYRINTATKTVSLFKVVGGVPTQIGADVTEDIVPKTSYVFTVATSFNTLTNETQIQTFLDSNKQHEIIDNTFSKGKFGYKTDGSTILQVDEIEMIQLPVDVQRINPGFDL